MKIMTGLKTLSSKLPCEPAKPMAASLPITCTATMVTRFGLRGIHFAGHDGGAGLVFGKNEFAEAAARAGSEPANVVGDFHERGGESFQRAAGEDDFVVRAERGEFVGMRAERQAGELGDFLRGAFGEFGMGVEAGADGGAADGEIVEAVESHGDAARRRDRAD